MQLALMEGLTSLHRHEIINAEGEREFNYQDNEGEIKVIQTGNRFS